MQKAACISPCLCKRRVFEHRERLNSHIFPQYGTLQFGKFEEIQKKGYQAAMDMLAKLEVEGRLPSLFIDGKDTPGSSKRKGQSARRNSI